MNSKVLITLRIIGSILTFYGFFWFLEKIGEWNISFPLYATSLMCSFIAMCFFLLWIWFAGESKQGRKK